MHCRGGFLIIALFLPKWKMPQMGGVNNCKLIIFVIEECIFVFTFGTSKYKL